MNRIRIVVLFSAATIFPPISNLVAQQPLAARVPFTFSVADRILPPGEYRIEHHGAFLSIEDRVEHRLITVIAYPGEPSHDGRAFLSFETLNGIRKLRGVATPDATRSVEVPPTRTRKQVREAERLPVFYR